MIIVAYIEPEYISSTCSRFDFSCDIRSLHQAKVYRWHLLTFQPHVLQDYWFLFDHQSLSAALLPNNPQNLPNEIYTQIKSYVNWLPFNPELNSVAKLYLKYGLAGAVCSLAPAPFCCSRTQYLKWTPPQLKRVGLKWKPIDKAAMRERIKNGQPESDDEDESNNVNSVPVIEFSNKRQEGDVLSDMQVVDERRFEEAVRSSRTVYVDKHALLHRLYVGLDMHFGNRGALHQSLALFLPETHRVLAEPTPVGRASQYLQLWKQSMESSIKAAQNAAEMGVPQFHWANVYRF